MSFLCDKKVDYKVFGFIMVLLLAVALLMSLCGCSEWTECVYQDVPRQHVNENVKALHNKSEMSIGDFLIRAGQDIKHMQEYLGVEVYKIKIAMGRDLFRESKIYTVWVYYTKKADEKSQ